MNSSTVLAIESVVAASDAVVECLVRCIEGSAMIGDTVELAYTNTGQEVVVSLKIQRILRYERVVDFFDAPHVAKVELVGRQASEVANFSRLHVSNR